MEAYLVATNKEAHDVNKKLNKNAFLCKDLRKSLNQEKER